MGYRREYYDNDGLNLELDDNNMKMELKCSRPRETGPVTANYEHLRLSVKIDIDTARKISNLDGCMSFTATESVQVDAMNIDVNWYVTIDNQQDMIIFSMEFPSIPEEFANKNPDISDTPLFRVLLNSKHRDIIYMTNDVNNVVVAIRELLATNDMVKGHIDYAERQNDIRGRKMAERYCTVKLKKKP